MAVQVLDAAAALAQLERFDAVIDVRSPAEFGQDHLPGAVNWPVLDDEERREVGTEYKQVSSFEARKRGAMLVARHLAEHVERHVLDKPRGWTPLVYCWRGGQRSGTVAWFLDQIGFRTHVLRGGYKAFRQLVLAELDTLPLGLDFRVVCGQTGCGKTRLLGALAEAGAQVLDLEGLACHRGSVLGGLPLQPQPAQRLFETRLWHALRRFDAARPVWVEAESRKIGQVHLPEALIQRMRRDGRCVRLDLPDDERVRLLLEDYQHLTKDPTSFEQLLRSLVPIRGHAAVNRWAALAHAGRWAAAFGELMREHYDPGYLASTQRNFAGFDTAHAASLSDAGADSMRRAAAALIAWSDDELG